MVKIKSYLLDIVFFKPDLVVPVDADLVHPLFGLQLDYRTTPLWTKHTVRQPVVRYDFAWLLLVLVDQIDASLAVPRAFVLRVLLVKLSPVAARVHHHEAHLAYCKILSFFIFILLPFGIEADVAEPIIFIHIVIMDKIRVHVPQIQYLLRSIVQFIILVSLLLH